MRRKLSDGLFDYEFIEPDQLVVFREEDAAVRFLRKFLGDENARHVLRGLAEEFDSGTAANLTDEQVLRKVAFKLVSGRKVVVFTGDTIKAQPVLAVEPETEAPPPAQTKPARAPKESSDTSGMDDEAQTDTLKRAAEEGAPFCEECEKARQEALKEREPAPAPAPPPPPEQEPQRPAPARQAPIIDGPPMDVDSPAQSDTLKRAAVDGVPFCEECERARQALAAGST